MSVSNLSCDSYISSSYELLKTTYTYKNTFAEPKIDKICINIGLAKEKFDSKQIQDVEEYLTKLTNQKPKRTQAKKAISNFKTRKGDVVGLVLTLRGKKATQFMLNLVYISLPRSRDFKGVKSESFSKDYSSYSLGIMNTNIFPTIGFDATVTFGMQINIVFKTATQDNMKLLTALKLPFKK
jgi:large subunit ribosomal protein L5